MCIFVFYIVLLLLEIALYIIAIIKNQKRNWNELLIIESVSILGVIGYVFLNNMFSLAEWKGLTSTFAFFIGFIPFVLLLIITFITQHVLREKIENTKTHSFFVYLISSIVILYVLVIFFDIVNPIIIEKNTQKEFKTMILNYLNEKYGNKDFNVINIEYESNNCFLCHIDDGAYENPEYVFTITSSNKDSFIVKIDAKTKEIIFDNYLKQ